LPCKGFGPDRRLRRPAEFQRVYRRGIKFITPVLVFFLHTGEGDQARLGLSVSRKVGKAVKRNRIKRLTREAFRLSWGEQRVDMVVSPRRGAAQQPLSAYRRCFDLLAGQLRKGILKQEGKEP
jgi:ribonuclease P protein component